MRSISPNNLLLDITKIVDMNAYPLTFRYFVECLGKTQYKTQEQCHFQGIPKKISFFVERHLLILYEVPQLCSPLVKFAWYRIIRDKELGHLPKEFTFQQMS